MGGRPSQEKQGEEQEEGQEDEEGGLGEEQEGRGVAQVLGAAPAVAEAAFGIIANVGGGDQEAASEELHIRAALVGRDELSHRVELVRLLVNLDTARGHPTLHRVSLRGLQVCVAADG